MTSSVVLQRAILPAALLLAMGSLYAGDVAAQAAQGTTTVGEITPKVFVYDYFSGPGEERTAFLERYDYRKGLSGDRRSDVWLDADFRLTMSDAERDLLVVERLGFGRYNHRNKVTINREAFAVTGYFRQFRSATGGIDYLFSPNQVVGGTDASYFFPAQTNANSGYIAQYNDDTRNQNFNIKRSTYGFGVTAKPTLFNGMGSLRANFDGYQRDGRQLFNYALGGGDIREAGTNASTAARVLQRWRGFDQEVDETNRRVSVTAMLTPRDLFQLSYTFSWDKYDNNATNGTHADITQFLSPGWQYNTGGDITRPLGFVADSHLLSHGVRLAKTFGRTAIAAGYGQSRLEQDTFTQPQQRLGFDNGEVQTDNAYFNFSSTVFSRVGLQGFYKYTQRDNDSSFPVVGLLNPSASEQLGVRINRLESDSYGLSASYRSRPLKSGFTLAWKHEDKDRNLTFHDSAIGPPAVNGISAERSLYSEHTSYDEIALKIDTRLSSAWHLRVTPSYLWASQTALVTEPEKQFKVKSNLTYMAPGGAFWSAYYNYVDKSNNDHALLATDGTLATQDIDRTAQSAGLSVSMNPSEWVTLNAGFSWLQDDFEGLFFSSNRRRYEAPGNTVLFLLRDRSDYNIDTYVFNAGGDWKVNDDLTWNASYNYSQSTGNTASGLILSSLPSIDGRVDNAVHSLAVGVRYQINPKMLVSSSYVLDYYDDDAFDQLTGGVHSIMVGLSVAF